MRVQRDIPAEWAERMIDRGFQHNGKASARRLADECGVAVGAVLRVIFRENFGDATALAIGKALRDEQFVADWVGVNPGEPWIPPLSSRTLTPQQRVLLDQLVGELTGGGQAWSAGVTLGSEDDSQTGGIAYLDRAARQPKRGTASKDQPEQEPS